MNEALREIQSMRGKTAIFFDTETSGLPASGGASLTRQPCTVQLAWVLARLPDGDMACREIASGSAIIQLPHGRSIDPGAERVHGITTEFATLYGIRFAAAWAMMAGCAELADYRIAHNIKFDDRQLQWDVERLPNSVQGGEFRRLSETLPICTMELSRDLCAIPPTDRMRASGRHGFKTPKLTESHKILTGDEMTNAHDAMADVRGCMRVFEELLTRGEDEKHG